MSAESRLSKVGWVDSWWLSGSQKTCIVNSCSSYNFNFLHNKQINFNYLLSSTKII